MRQAQRQIEVQELFAKEEFVSFETSVSISRLPSPAFAET
jgi:hypothetical protein